MDLFSPAQPLTRREAIQRILLASALAVSLDVTAFAAEDIRRIGEDPDLLKKEIPWPRILTAEERHTLEVLGDLIIPADENGPAASAVGITDFLDEWLSAPYEQQQKDLTVIRPGLVWLDKAAQQRTQKNFAQGTPEQQIALLTEITTKGTDANRDGLKFFRLIRDRVAGGYYSTPVGWKAIGYTGNTPAPNYPGPPAETLARLGLA